ncbi:MAG: 8-amino-7-oxononanoate synthase [Pseudomonadota bacterium]
MTFADFFQSRKREWEQNQSFRQLKTHPGIDFCSNDYLGLSKNQELVDRVLESLRDVPLGSGSSRLIKGHSTNIHALEERLASFCGREAALFFPSGYQANLGIFSCLIKKGARVFSDSLIHASIIDGIKLAGGEKFIWQHNDLSHLESLLKERARPDRLNFVVCESIYSMQGDLAPLRELSQVCQRFGALLIVDEAHATGLYGDKGSGLVEELQLQDQVFATIHTGGKALGVSGAWVAGSKDLKTFMVNQSRPFIYSTAPSHHQQVAIFEAVNLIEEQGAEMRREFFLRLMTFQSKLNEKVHDHEFKLLGMGGPITSLVVGSNEKALNAMESLWKKGCDVRAIRYPTVPKNESLLRMTIPLSRTSEEITQLFSALLSLIKESL